MPRAAHNSVIMKFSSSVLATVLALLAEPAGAIAQAPATALRLPLVAAPFLGLPGAYPLTAYPQGPCAMGICADHAALGRSLRRELQQQELRRELDARAESAARAPNPNPYLAPRYLPPPTPDSQLQPRYRGTGEIRPEFQRNSQARQ